MTKFYKVRGGVCDVCRKKDQWYYEGNRKTCAECIKERARVYSKSKRGRVSDRDRRRGVRGRSYYEERLEKEGRRDVLRKSLVSWKDRNWELNRVHRMVLARIHYKVKTGEIQKPLWCQECTCTGEELYVYVDWSGWLGVSWIPEFTWVCSLCLGRHRQKT